MCDVPRSWSVASRRQWLEQRFLIATSCPDLLPHRKVGLFRHQGSPQQKLGHPPPSLGGRLHGAQRQRAQQDRRVHTWLPQFSRWEQYRPRTISRVEAASLFGHPQRQRIALQKPRCLRCRSQRRPAVPHGHRQHARQLVPTLLDTSRGHQRHAKPPLLRLPPTVLHLPVGRQASCATPWRHERCSAPRRLSQRGRW